MTESELDAYTSRILAEIETDRDIQVAQMAEQGHRDFRYRLDGVDIDLFVANEERDDGRRLPFLDFQEIKARVAAECGVDLAHLAPGQRGA